MIQKFSPLFPQPVNGLIIHFWTSLASKFYTLYNWCQIRKRSGVKTYVLELFAITDNNQCRHAQSGLSSTIPTVHGLGIVFRSLINQLVKSLKTNNFMQFSPPHKSNMSFPGLSSLTTYLFKVTFHMSEITFCNDAETMGKTATQMRIVEKRMSIGLLNSNFFPNICISFQDFWCFKRIYWNVKIY